MDVTEGDSSVKNSQNKSSYTPKAKEDQQMENCTSSSSKESVKEKGFSHKQRKDVHVSELSRQELEAKYHQLEAYNRQLQNLLAKSLAGADESEAAKKKKKNQREFDFTKHSRRHVLLKFAYLGWDYQGFAVQEDTLQTVEAQLFSALLKTRLIQSRETSNYHRCGRTDKGVSAFEQVISITLRSKLRSGIGLMPPESTEAPPNATSESKNSKGTGMESRDEEEINYALLLNKVLPPEIRMLAWCPVDLGYSARFDCSYRTYKYFFPRGNLNIKMMHQAAQHLVGSHDYRNFCKMDVGNGVVNFCRRILSIRISPICCDVLEKSENKPLSDKLIESQKPTHPFEELISCERQESNKDNSDHRTCRSELRDSLPVHCRKRSDAYASECSSDDYGMCVATIEGQAFLWHQVRAIMAVLLLVGEEKEEPGIVLELLDVEKHPRKPQYCLASDVPLNLYGTTFEGINWRWENETLHSVITQFQALWTQYSIRTTMIRRMLWDLESRYIDMTADNCMCELEKEDEEYMTEEKTAQKYKVRKPPVKQIASLFPDAQSKVHRPLLSRPTCESLETRVEHYVKRQRLDPDIFQKMTSSSGTSDTYISESRTNEYQEEEVSLFYSLE